MTTHAETATQTLGQRGEEIAARYLRDRGWTILDRNWRCAEGEVDLVAMDGDSLVICEVKTRGGLGVGDPIEAVTWRKVLRLRRLAAIYLRTHQMCVSGVRIDVIGIVARRGETAQLRHVVAVQS